MARPPTGATAAMKGRATTSMTLRSAVRKGRAVGAAPRADNTAEDAAIDGGNVVSVEGQKLNAYAHRKSQQSLQRSNYIVDVRGLRYAYLSVYAILMLADWLQGTNMYTLYQSYGVNVGALFLTGFCSSAICGTFVGSFVDKVGTRNGCIMYCVLEILIQALEHVNDFGVLLIGRVIGGLTTSLLFSAFESWLVAKHRAMGLSHASLEGIFASASIINGLMAIIAGIIARMSFLASGDIGPFQVAAALTCVAMCLIVLWWDDPSDHAQQASKKSSPSSAMSFTGLIANAWTDATRSSATMTLGLSCALFEGAMYTFVFMWVPVLQSTYDASSGERAPTEIAFSCMMVCVALGGVVFNRTLSSTTISAGGASIFAIASFAMAGCAAASLMSSPPRALYLCLFFAFEISVGAFHPWAAAARARLFPPRALATLMNLFRVPLNAVVVAGVALSSNVTHTGTFVACAFLHAVAAAATVVNLKKN